MDETRERRRFAERSGSFIGLMLLGGRVLERAGAFGQVLLIAAVLGSTTRADLYFVASIVPLAIGNVVGEALAATVLARAAREREPQAERILSAGLWLAASVLGTLTILYLVAVSAVVPRAAPAGTASLLPWLAFAPIAVFFGLGAYCAAPLLHYERYVWPALRGASATLVGLALSAVVLALGGGVVWLGLAISTGYGVALLLLVLELASIGRGRIFAPPGVGAVRIVLSLWRKVGASAASGVVGGQMLVLIERALAAPLGVGSVASISYARGVAYTPTVLGQAIAAGVYPSVLRAHAADAVTYVRGRFLSGLRLALFVTAVTTTYLALFSTEIAIVLFGRDAVSPEALEDVQRCLVAFSFALVGWMLTILSARLFGALDLFRGLILQELVTLLVYVVLALPLRDEFGVAGLALALGIGHLAGGLAALGLIARRLEVPLSAIAVTAVLPAVLRAAPVVVAVVLVERALAAILEAPSLVSVLVGAAAASLAAVVVLWPAEWEELDSMRAFLRARRAAPARE